MKAHAIVLAKQSKVFADQFYPLVKGQSFPIVVIDLTRVGANETALESFVRMLYGAESDPATLDMEDLIGLHRFSKHYLISDLRLTYLRASSHSRFPSILFPLT